MSDNLRNFCATDKEIYDLLMSGKQKITESVLHILALDRGIFYSNHETRESLVDKLSSLTHDSYDICSILQQREQSRRGEKTTFTSLDISLSSSEIKEVVQMYQAEMRANETIIMNQKGNSKIIVDLEYDEIDYSRTRLIQRQSREANFEIETNSNNVIILMPATDKAKEVVENLKNKIESYKKTEVKSQEIELSHLLNANERTRFFTYMISNIPGFSLKTVTNLKVASLVSVNEEEEDLEEENEIAGREMLSVVYSVAINGQNLVASKEYQDLIKRGFYVTNITWRSTQIEPPHTMIQFDVGFKEAEEGKGFNYGIRCSNLLKNGEYAKNFKPVDDNIKCIIFELIESTARNALNELSSNLKTDQGASDKQESS